MKHLILFFACAISLMANSQVTPPYLQTFDGTAIPADWSQVDNTDPATGNLWEFGTVTGWDPEAPFLTGNYAILNSDITPGTDVQNADLVSPTFNCTTLPFVQLSFKHFFRYFPPSSATISYSIDNGATWTAIKTWINSSSNPEIFSQIIPAAANQSQVKFKWNYTGTDAWGWAVDDVSVSIPPVATWSGAISTDFNNSLNWVGGVVPDADYVVTIPSTTNKPVIDANESCLTLTIELGASVTINPSNSLTVGLLTNNSSTGIIIKSDATGTGSLIAGSATGTGTAQVERYMTVDRWYNISSPVLQSVATFLSDNTNIPLKAGVRGMTDYNTLDDDWNTYYTDAILANTEIAKGYLLRTDASGFVLFTGTLNAGEQAIQLSNQGNGWNLIGNPYTSAIKINNPAGANNFLSFNTTSIDVNYFGIYVWNGASYDIINHATGSEYVTVGQGFFVKNTDGTTANFTPEMQVHQPTVVLKSGVVVIPEIKLFVTSAKKSTFTSIKFFKEATTGLDKGYDAGIFKSDPSFSVFTHLVNDNNVEFALQCLPLTNIGTMTVPMGIDCSLGGEVTFNSQLFNLQSGNKIVLEDRLLNVFTTFNDEKSAYSTTLAANSKGTGRFFLHVSSAQTTGIDNKELANKINVWMDRNEIVIQGVTEKNAIAALYDVRGSLILKKNLENITTNRVNVIGINSGIYMLQVVENGKRTGIKLQISGN